MEIILHIQRVTAAAFPGVMLATAAEWWCHSRPHSSGHQMHFDSDDEGIGGVRNPIISTVTCVCVCLLLLLFSLFALPVSG